MVTTTYLPAYLWENSDSSDSSNSSNSGDKIKIVTKLKTQIVMVVIVKVVTVVVRVTYFIKNNQLHTLTSVWCVQGSFSQSCDVYILTGLVLFLP